MKTLRTIKTGILGAALFAAMLAGSGCEMRKKMYDQPKFESLEKTDFFGDARSARPTIEGTVPRGHLNDNEPYHTGKKDGAYLSDLPKEIKLTPALLDRGQERYEIYCSVCHGFSGYGDGMVVQRGYKQPSSYHSERLLGMDIGYFYEVMTKGYGVMSSYSYQVTPEDRWAIAAYIRTLQVSQRADTGQAKANQPALAGAEAPVEVQ
jgi:mono/diheme cytochrome c family protein